MEEEGINENQMSACRAYIESCGVISLSNFEENYQGQFKDDESFAENMADQMGLIGGLNWPHTCIDLERASRELMMDYNEQDGHYFIA